MELTLTRTDYNAGCTIGRLQINGLFYCFTCEDVDRQLETKPEAKLHGRTAIPKGRYQVDITMSSRFNKLLPLLLNVPGFAGIRIHPGNTAADTEGCILPGLKKNGTTGVLESRVAFEPLYGFIRSAIARQEKVHITVQ